MGQSHEISIPDFLLKSLLLVTLEISRSDLRYVSICTEVFLILKSFNKVKTPVSYDFTGVKNTLETTVNGVEKPLEIAEER